MCSHATFLIIKPNNNWDLKSNNFNLQFTSHWCDLICSFVICTIIFIKLIYLFSFSRFFVDDVPIRRYPRRSATTFPLRPMWVYGSIWDASSWATEDGKYKIDFRYQPFYGKFINFKASGCTAYSPARCRPVSASPYRSGRLTGQQTRAMQWVQSHSKVYDYCQDYKRDHSKTPECWRWIEI